MEKQEGQRLSENQIENIRKHAEDLLEKADAKGRFPTPIVDIMDSADVEVIKEDALNPTFLSNLRKDVLNLGKGFTNALKSALSKVLGVIDTRAGRVFIDKTVIKVKQTFLQLHEAGHYVLPWQRQLYGVVEDCKMTISPEVSEMFDAEANAFASEVLFQLDRFTEEAEEHDFGIFVPVKLSKKFGSSIYSAVRRYVSNNRKACSVIVLNPPEFVGNKGYVSTLRRVVSSKLFEEIFGELSWPSSFSPDDEIGNLIPLHGRRASRPREIVLRDRNGNYRVCMAEAFTNTHQVFILVLEIYEKNINICDIAWQYGIQ